MKPNIIHRDEEFIAWQLMFYELSQFAYPSDHTHNLNGKTMAHGLMCTCSHHASIKLYNWSIVFSSSTSVVIIAHPRQVQREMDGCRQSTYSRFNFFENLVASKRMNLEKRKNNYFNNIMSFPVCHCHLSTNHEKI